jgi:hypothetical protein
LSKAATGVESRICYNIPMTKKELKEILERVLTWPEDRQENAARVLTEIEEYDATEYRRMDVA